MVNCTAKSRKCGKRCVGLSRGCYQPPRPEYNCNKAKKATLLKRMGIPAGKKVKKSYLVGLCRRAEEVKRRAYNTARPAAACPAAARPTAARPAAATPKTARRGWDCVKPYRPGAKTRDMIDSCRPRPGGKYSNLQTCVEECASWKIR